MDPGQRLGEVDPDQERAGQPGSVRDGDPVDVAPASPGVGQRGVQDGHDPAQMGPRGHLGHDPAGGRVQGDLAGDDVRVDPAAALDEGDPGLVAARLDGQQERSRHGRPGGGGDDPGAGGSISGRAASFARRPVRRACIRCSPSGSVVMIRRPRCRRCSSAAGSRPGGSRTSRTGVARRGWRVGPPASPHGAPRSDGEVEYGDEQPLPYARRRQAGSTANVVTWASSTITQIPA